MQRKRSEIRKKRKKRKRTFKPIFMTSSSEKKIIKRKYIIAITGIKKSVIADLKFKKKISRICSKIHLRQWIGYIINVLYLEELCQKAFSFKDIYSQLLMFIGPS